MANEVNIVIKALNKATPIFAKIKEDAIKMVQGIGGKQVSINTASAKKGLTEVGKEADATGKKLDKMAKTPMEGLIAGIRGVGKALAGIAIVSAITAAIAKVREWRDEWMMALEKVGKAEIEFQRKMADAAKVDPGIKKAAEEARFQAIGAAGLAPEQKDRTEFANKQKSEIDAKNDEIDAIQKAYDDQVRLSAALNIAKNDLTGFAGSLKAAGAKIEKEFEETIALAAKEGGDAESNKRILDLVQNFNSPEMTAEMERVRGEARIQGEAAKRGLSASAPVLEKHERAAQERLRDIAVEAQKLDTAQKEKGLIQQRHSAEMITRDRMEEGRRAEAERDQQLMLAEEHSQTAEKWQSVSKTGKSEDKEIAKELVRTFNPLADPHAREVMSRGADVANKLKATFGPRPTAETDEIKLEKIRERARTGRGPKLTAKELGLLKADESKKNADLAIKAAKDADIRARQLLSKAAESQVKSLDELVLIRQKLDANLQAR